ncbi:hypothetical protein [Jiella sonneratiae]|uniref:Uncharacterized protein n=1 Tax=Jiella sonneratiae TaxID=2816856 RepID=A0ABS3J3U5_9HYPH|nr:hypothetical protein [Jiella sonneratiae]MBO0903790.1 hypothetical protein [Jiella sonneratiae]
MASAIEKSLRRALAKGNAADPDHRLEIYEAAERALLRLEETNGMSGEAKDRHRLELIAAIESIEADFSGPDGSVPPTPAAETGDAGNGDAGRGAEASKAPEVVEAERIDPPAAPQSLEPQLAFEAEERVVDVTPDDDAGETGTARPGAGSRLGRRVIALVIVLLLLFLVGVGVWIVLPFLSSGAASDGDAKSAASATGGDLSVADAIRENAGTVAGAAAEPEWTDLYSPEALREFARSDPAIEDATKGGQRARLKLTQPAGPGDAGGTADAAAGREIELPIPGEVARRFAGKNVEGEIVVGSPDGKPRVFTLRCLFGGETVCGRQRFTTSLPEENFLFHLELPPEAATGGQIAVDPSVGDAGKDLFLYGMRLRRPV